MSLIMYEYKHESKCMPKSKIGILLKHKCVLVHCAGFVKMVGNEDTNSLTYLGRLNRVVKDTNTAIACSTVSHSDTYEKGNYTGRLGVVIRPKEKGSILDCSSEDAGTTPEGREKMKDNMKSSDSDFESAIVNRGRDKYNEICVCEYEIMGVFFDYPVQYSDENGNYKDVTSKEIYDNFGSEMSYYFLLNGDFFKAEYDLGSNEFKIIGTAFCFYL